MLRGWRCRIFFFAGSRDQGFPSIITNDNRVHRSLCLRSREKTLRLRSQVLAGWDWRCPASSFLLAGASFVTPTRGADFMPNRSKNKELSVRAHSVCTFVAKPGILSYDFSYVLITFFLVYSSDQCPSKRSMRERLYTITSEYTLDKRQDSKD